MGRICREVQAQLPGVVDGTARWWRRRVVALHMRRCEDCRVELERQETVAAGLEALGAATLARAEDPPEELLDALLEHAQQPGMRGRAAVPARGAVSGARPALSVALLVAGAATGTAVGYVTWRAVRAGAARRRGGRRRARS